MIAFSSNGEDTVSVAKKMVFMLRPVFKPPLAFTVAAYPTRDINLVEANSFPLRGKLSRSCASGLHHNIRNES